MAKDTSSTEISLKESAESLIEGVLSTIDDILEWASLVERRQMRSDEQITTISNRLNDIESRLNQAEQLERRSMMDRARRHLQ